jgi:hypothetical protein
MTIELEILRMPKLVHPARNCRRTLIAINSYIIEDLTEGLDELRSEYDKRVKDRVAIFQSALGVKAMYGRGRGE